MPGPITFAIASRPRRTLCVFSGKAPQATTHAIGNLSLDDSGYFSMVDAASGRAAFLHGLVDHLNNIPFLAWNEQEPDEESEASFARNASVLRGQPGFISILCDHAYRHYGVRLI